MASYDQGRTKWQADTLNGVWLDEEPPEPVYTEALARTAATNGIIMLTFTPLLGMSQVVMRYVMKKVPGTCVTQMSLEDAPHITPERRVELLQAYPEHARDARARGIPQLGSGRVFPIDEDEIRVKAFQIPDYWPRIGGLDFGYEHPTAAVEVAHDPDMDCIYVIAAHRAQHQTPMQFAPIILQWGGRQLPWAWPQDGLQHDKGSGHQLKNLYKECGLNMLALPASNLDGTFGLEAGIQEMLDRMRTGRLKVFDHLTEWWEEFRIYHRKEGLIVKLNDDLISATRYAMMMRRLAVPISQRGLGMSKSGRAQQIRPDGLGWMAT
jgi:phage terminase large subunit-like protein